jgi:hypothetical protein
LIRSGSRGIRRRGAGRSGMRHWEVHVISLWSMLHSSHLVWIILGHGRIISLGAVLSWVERGIWAHGLHGVHISTVERLRWVLRISSWDLSWLLQKLLTLGGVPLRLIHRRTFLFRLGFGSRCRDQGGWSWSSFLMVSGLVVLGLMLLLLPGHVAFFGSLRVSGWRISLLRRRSMG